MGRKAIMVTEENLAEVLIKFGEYLKENEAPELELLRLVNCLDETLDSLMQYDYFGTEGQSDPRGDWRD